MHHHQPGCEWQIGTWGFDSRKRKPTREGKLLRMTPALEAVQTTPTAHCFFKRQSEVLVSWPGIKKHVSRGPGRARSVDGDGGTTHKPAHSVPIASALPNAKKPHTGLARAAGAKRSDLPNLRPKIYMAHTRSRADES